MGELRTFDSLSNQTEGALPPVNRVLRFGAVDAMLRVLQWVRHFALPAWPYGQNYPWLVFFTQINSGT